jgi:hypothetical protein
MVLVTCLYGHVFTRLPRMPKLVHSPFPLTIKRWYLMSVFIEKSTMSIAGYSRLNSLTVEAQRGGMEGFLVGCCSRPVAVALSCFFPAAVAGAGVPKDSITKHVRYDVICTLSTKADTVVCSIEQGRGSPYSHFSHTSKNCRES